MVLGFGNKRMMSERELLILYPSRKGANCQLETNSVMPLKHSDDCLRFQTYLVLPIGGQQMQRHWISVARSEIHANMRTNLLYPMSLP
jgi:hypothetical protein